MHKNLSAEQFLIAFSNKIQRAATSIRRQSDINFSLTKSLHFLFIFIVVMPVNTSGSDRKSLTHSKVYDATKPPCGGCFKLQQAITSGTFPEDRPKSADLVTKDCFSAAKILRRLCGSLSYVKCYFKLKVKQEPLKELLSEQKDVLKCKLKNNEININDVVNVDQETSLTEETVKPKSFMSTLAKSRTKRLAMGDRRLVHLYCRTNFILQIKENGKVIGNHKKSKKG